MSEEDIRLRESLWLGAALVLRLAFALKLGDGTYQIDEGGYFIPSWNFALHGVLGEGAQPEVVPAIPNAFFGFFYFIFGPHRLAPRLAQAVVGAATAWMIGRMTRDLAGSKRAGEWSLAVAAVYPFFIYYGGILMAETLYVALAVPGLWWLCSSLAEGSTKKAAWAGAALGLAALCRSEAAPIMLVIWLVLAAACALRRWSWRSWALGTLCWALPILGWCWRNQQASGRFALDIHGGVTMLHGTLLFDLNEVDTGVAMDAVKEMPFYQRAQALSEAERDKVYMGESFRFIRQNPRAVARQWGRKFINFWRFYPRRDKIYLESKTNQPRAGLSRGALTAVSLLFEPWLILGGLAGLGLLARRRLDLAPMLFFVLGTMGIHVISVSQMRYRLPVMPFLMMGLAYLAAEKLCAFCAKEKA